MFGSGEPVLLTDTPMKDSCGGQSFHSLSGSSRTSYCGLSPSFILVRYKMISKETWPGADKGLIPQKETQKILVFKWPFID
jgi:hypothetical protein